MRNALIHRGPDGSGMEFFDHAALAHNRLAIIDIEGGRQPMAGAGGKIHVVFNGEIYNFRELRQALAGYPFSTRTDTEVILALYEKYGASGWRRLRGMYAFALWDDARETGFLVRDPMGIKPLFYVEGERLSFGSEAKALFAYGRRPTLDAGALHRTLNFRYVAGDESLFRGIRQLPPGTLLQWTQGRVRHSCIAADVPMEPEAGREERFSTETWAELFEAAVEEHLASDVPVGCFLSGGIDSALIAKAASLKTPLTSYTLEAGDDPDEAENAKRTADWLGIPNRRHAFSVGDVVARHRELLIHLEAPKVNALQSMALAEFARPHVKVALSGLGGDEIFYGYNAHWIMWAASAASRALPLPAFKAIGAMLGHRTDQSRWTERDRALEMFATIPAWPRVYGILRNVWDTPNKRRRFYGERMLDSNAENCFDWLTDRFPSGGDPVFAMARFELKNKLVNDLLWHEDRVSMRVGLETRVPFLDNRLVGYATRFPRSELMPWGRKKDALRRYASKKLPRSILRRPKSGFQLDIATLVGGALVPLFDEYLSEERLRHHRLFNPRFVAEIRALPASRRFRWHWFLIYLMAQTHMLVEELDVA